MNAQHLALVTRTPPEGALLAARLRQLGFDAFNWSPIGLAGPPEPHQTAARLRGLLPTDRVIITSPEGIRQAVSLVGAEAFGSSQIVVPGRGSARQAKEMGLSGIVFPDRGGNSEAMLELPELREVKGMRVLILAAEGGRRLLEESLGLRGARVDRLHVYQRLKMPLPPDLEQRVVHAPRLSTLISSGGALEAAHKQMSTKAWQRVSDGWVLVPSERVADMARALGCQQTVNAGGADDQAMIACLVGLTSESHLR